MSKGKLEKFAENLTFPNLFQPDYEEIKQGFKLKGNWRADFFKNENPIVLELGCGKGEYTIGLGQKYLDKNFIGIDWKGARLWRGCRNSKEANLTNVAFVRAKIEHIQDFFSENEIDEIWITFPDPQPKFSKQNKRLTSPRFLQRYKSILKPNSLIHFKTDNEPLFDYTLEVIESCQHKLHIAVKDIYNYDGLEEVKSIKTYYEKLFNDQGFDINYLNFTINPNWNFDGK